MRSVLYVIRDTPGAGANETIDLMLVSGVFEQPTSVLFLDDGVTQLVGNGDRIGRKDTANALKALPMYDVENLFVDSDSLAARGIIPESIDLPITMVDSAEVTRLLHDHDLVLTD